MGFTFAIGEFKKIHSQDEECYVWPDDVFLPDAPRSHVSAGCNCWPPSYDAWAEFASRNNLSHIFYYPSHELCLIPSHPGYAELTGEHLKLFRGARAVCLPEHEARLDWLIFWTEWALINCEKPVFANM